MPAIITIKVTAFRENASSTPPPNPNDNCTIDLNFDINGPTGPATGNWKKRDADGEVFLCQGADLGTIAVQRKTTNLGPVKLSFRIASDPGVPALTPLSLVLRQNKFRHNENFPLADRDGSQNFRNQVAEAGLLTVEDHWIDKDHSNNPNGAMRKAPHWKFWIRVKTNDGRLGWIDPIIENSDDMSAA